MNVIDLMTSLNKLNIRLWLEAGQLRFSAPHDAMSDAIRDQIKTHKPEIIQFLTQQQSLEAIPTISDRSGLLDLSFAQERLWFLEKLSPNNKNLHINSAFLITGPLNIDALTKSIQQLHQRHSVMHYAYTQTAKGVFAKKHHSGNAELAYFTHCQHQQDAIEHAQKIQPNFDLENAQLMWQSLYQLDEQQHLLYYSVHHIAGDGLSMAILAKELLQCYEAICTQQAPKLNDISTDYIDYIDYAAWQKQLVDNNAFKHQAEYWQQQLSDNEPLQLAIDYPRKAAKPSQPTNNGRSYYFTIDHTLSQHINQLAQQQHSTLFTVLISLWSALLYRYSEQKTFCIGTPVANRSQSVLENIFGCFVNMLAIKSSYQFATTFEQLLRQSAQHCQEAFANQDLPFEHVIKHLAINRDIHSSPVFQSLFTLQQEQDYQQFFSDISIKPQPLDKTSSQYDISLYATQRSDGSLLMELVYRSDLFSEAKIQQMAEHFITLSTAICQQPEAAIASHALINPQQLSNYQKAWQDNQISYPESTETNIYQLFQKQAAKTPNAIAISLDDTQLSYQQLADKTTALAARIEAYGQKNIVGLYFDRSIDFCIAMLAVLKTNAAYLPFNIHAPTQYNQRIIQASNLSLIVSHSAIWPDAMADVDSDVLLLDGEHHAQHNDEAIAQTGLFNIIYTSGSTGKPKGVMVPHSAMINRLLWMQATYPLCSDDKVLHKTPHYFDVSVWEILWPLINGAQLVLARAGEHKNSQYLSELIQQQQISHCHFVPAMLQAFINEPAVKQCTSLRHVFSSGEALSASLAQRFLAQLNCQLHNLYGPTEAAIDVSYYDCQGNEPTTPIGQAIANTQLQIINSHGQLAPTGAIGELSIGGHNLALGYLNNPEATAKAFIANPLLASQHPSPKLYKTGDLAYQDASGMLHYMGRNDSQIKIRGYRIELAAISQQLNQLKGIDDSLVKAISINDENTLVAYLLNSGGTALNIDDISTQLALQLPSYMLPQHFIELTAWPSFDNGKINHQALPLPSFIRNTQQAYVAPRNDIEEKLQGIWQGLLNVDKIGVYDNFFELGGHSLLAVQAIHQSQQHFQVHIALSDALLEPTIASAAQLIERATAQQSIIANNDNYNADDDEIIL